MLRYPPKPPWAVSMSLLQLIIIGLVQGVTEWLPISSSAHVLLAADLFALEGRDELLINAVSNAGTLAAMALYFRADMTRAIIGGFELLAAPLRRAPLSAAARLTLLMIVATPVALSAALAYALAPEHLTAPLRTPRFVATTTIGFGLLLWWADAKHSRSRGEADLTLGHAALIGATQAIAAVFPGTSRSGITMTAARALGYDRTEAARFSMLIGVPILAAASLYGVLQLAGAETAGEAGLREGAVVAVTAFLSGYASIAALMALLKRVSFLPFVIYRLALGVLLLIGAPVFFLAP